MPKSIIIVKRGTLGGGPWGYDVDLDGEQAAHTGTLTASTPSSSAAATASPTAPSRSTGRSSSG